MDSPKYKLRQRFMIGKAIYVITEINYDQDKHEYRYYVNSSVYYYESQLKDSYFTFVEPIRRLIKRK